MNTNIVIDDALINQAMNLTGLKTQKDVVEIALKTLILVMDCIYFMPTATSTR